MDEEEISEQLCGICRQHHAYTRISETGHRICLCPACYIEFGEMLELQSSNSKKQNLCLTIITAESTNQTI